MSLVVPHFRESFLRAVGHALHVAQGSTLGAGRDRWVAARDIGACGGWRAFLAAGGGA